MDYFLSDKNCVDRLIDEYRRYGKLIVALDYDNTIFDYYKKGHTFGNVIELVRRCKQEGFHITVFTSCDESRYPEIIAYMEENGIPYDSINETPDYIPFKGRKVYYNILLDDRAGLSSAYEQLWAVIYSIKTNEILKLPEIA